MIVFQKPGLKLNWNWNIRLNGFKLTLSDQIKYLGIYPEKHLNGHYQSKLITQKLARAIGMLSKIRCYLKKSELKICITLYLSHIFLIVVNVGSSLTLNFSKTN